MRMGAVMMRLSNLTLTSPAVTGLIMVTVLVLGAIVVRVVTVSEHGDVPTHIARDQGTLDCFASLAMTLMDRGLRDAQP